MASLLSTYVKVTTRTESHNKQTVFHCPKSCLCISVQNAFMKCCVFTTATGYSREWKRLARGEDSMQR